MSAMYKNTGLWLATVITIIIIKDPTSSFWTKNGRNHEICYDGRKNENRIFGRKVDENFQILTD